MVKKIYILLILSIILINFISASNVGLIENSTWQSNLTAVRFSATAFGDIDNDNDTDLILTGCLSAGALRCDSGVIAKVYINNGTTLNENQTWQQNLTGVGHSSIDLGDIDNDGDLDLALSGCDSATTGVTECQGNRFSKIYINNGTSLIESSQWGNNLTAVAIGSLAFGDIDNDGKSDLVLTGQLPSGYLAKIYINNGTSLVESSQWENNLTGARSGSVSLGDIDNDGDLDLDFAGYDGSSWFAKIYINNGTSLIEDSTWQQNFSNWGWPEIILGDIDNDGDLDEVRTGTLVGDHLNIYNNNGSTFLLNQTNEDGILVGFFDGSLAFGDYDNDGDLDLGAMGRDAEAGRDRIYENNQTVFEVDNTAYGNITNDIKDGSIAWLDLDDDNDLDLIMIGSSTNIGIVAKIYINNNTVSNTPPNASISGFSSSYSDGILNLTWNNGSDSETNSTGLYYNLMVGNSTTNHTIISGIYGGSSNPTAGYFGNMMQRKNISLNIYLNNETYYWYVQTIDTGLAKSNWSTGQSIFMGADTTAPNISSVSSSVTSSTATITWTTNESANSTLHYGITTATTSSSSSSSLTTSHSISLSSLSASTLYYYNVSSCDYWGNCNTSSQYNFTTSAAPSNGDSGNGGDGGGGGIASFWTQTYTISDEDFNKGVVKELGKKQRVKINVSGESHYVGVVNITNTTATINITSDPIQVVLDIGEEAKVDVLDDGFYDIYVLLNDINESKVNLTIKSIYEEIPEGGGRVATTGEEIEEEEKKKDLTWLYWLIGVGVIVIILVSIKFKVWEKWQK